MYKSVLRTFSIKNFQTLNRKLVLCDFNGRKQFHQYSALCYRKFKGSENSFSYETVKKSLPDNFFMKPEDITCSTITLDEVIETRNWKDKPLQDLVDSFELVSKYCNLNNVCISDDRFDHLAKAIKARCEQFEDDQIATLLKCLALLPETRGLNTKNFVDLWMSLDDVCLSRVKIWDKYTIIRFLDHWYGLGLIKVANFSFKAIMKAANKADNLDRDRVIRIMFYLNVYRKATENMCDFEVFLRKNIDDLTINELSVMCAGFFKTKTPIRETQLLHRIYDKTIENLDTINDIALAAILKILRYSSKLSEVPQIYRLLDSLSERIHKFNLLTLVHIALLGSEIQMCHQKCLEKIIERFANELQTARLKDLERITFVMSLFNIEMENGREKDLCQLILADLKDRVEECVTYPRCFGNMLNYLITKGFYDVDLINSVLDPKFIKLTFGKHFSYPSGRDIFSVDVFTKVFLKDTYQGHHLPEKIWKTMARLQVHYVPSRNQKPKLTAFDRQTLEVMETYQQYFGPCHLTHILPQFQRPEIICLTDLTTKQPLEVEQLCPPQYSGNILSRDYLLNEKANDQNICLFVLVIGGWNQYVRDIGRKTGSFQMKLTQLEKIGYKCVLIPWFEWTKLTPNSRESYLKYKISESVYKID